jgi:BlaI family penicillinase repressor
MRHPLPELSGAELDVMRILWRDGRMSAREIHDAVKDATGWEYSTTRTVLGRLVSKGAAAKADFHGLQVYRARVSRPEGLVKLVREFAGRVIQSDPELVVSLFAKAETLSPAELKEIRRLLARLDGERDR